MKGFKGYINLLTGCLIFVAFLLLNLTTVEFAPQDFLGVLLNSGLMMICWLLIRNAFAEQGLISGQKDSEVKATKKEHLITSNEISTYRADFNIWCENKNAERLKQKRVAILSGSSLLYEDYFDEYGNFKDKEVTAPKEFLISVEKKYKKLQKKNKKINKINNQSYKQDCKLLNKARFAFVPPYEPEDIVAKENLSSKKKLFGLSVKQWKNIKIFSSVVMSLVISVMLSFVKTKGKMLEADAWLILAFELLIMAGSAFAFYFSASNFICSDWREGLIQKVRIMEEFYRNIVGTVTYENDIKKEDGSTIIGKKIFAKKADYMPLKASKDEREERKEAQSNIQAKAEKTLAMASQECIKPPNDIVDSNSRTNILGSSNSVQHAGFDSQSVVVDNHQCDNALLGGTVHSGTATSNSVGDWIESNLCEEKKETNNVKEKTNI